MSMVAFPIVSLVELSFSALETISLLSAAFIFLTLLATGALAFFLFFIAIESSEELEDSASASDSEMSDTFFFVLAPAVAFFVFLAPVTVFLLVLVAEGFPLASIAAIWSELETKGG